MNLRLDGFFENPTIMSAIVVIVFILSQVAIVWLQNRKHKKDNQRADETAKKTVSTFEDLTSKIQALIDKEMNNVNLVAADIIITSVLNSSKNAIIKEIRRIFTHNHREQLHRQKLIRRSFGSLTKAVYDSDMHVLSIFYYKEKRLSEFMTNIDTDDFFHSILNLIFSVNNAESDFNDVIFSVESYFDSFIIQARQYYSNL
jgi:hypothetical protein